MTPFTRIFDQPELFDFFITLRRLERHFRDKPRISDSATTREEYVSLGQNPYLEFPDSNLSKVTRDSSGRFDVLVKFLGLLGPQGALPLSTTDEAHSYLLANDDAFARFLDLFNNRFLQLFFRAWADSRPIVHHDRPADDRFESYVGSAIGLGSPVYRDLDSVPDIAKIGYAGLIGSKVKSASRLRSLIAGLFGVEVEVDEFMGLRIMFDPDQRSTLGQKHMVLGKDALCGAGVYSVEDKIRIRIYVKSLKEYQEYLPTGPKSRPLAEIMFFYLGVQLDWDVELALPVGEVVPSRLGQSGQLGWTSWMSPNWTVEKGTYRTDARFNLATRFGHA